MNCSEYSSIVKSTDASVRHASHELPRHPLMDTPIIHPDQHQTTLIRVHPDADMKYAEDKRFQDVAGEQRSFACQLINKLAGNEYQVLSMVSEGEDYYYNIFVRPKFFVFDTLGRPLEIGYAFLPVDYATTVKPGFWEAR